MSDESSSSGSSSSSSSSGSTSSSSSSVTAGAGWGAFWPACCNCGGTPELCGVTVCVTGCPAGTPLAGAVVTVRSGGYLVGTCVTAAGGCCSMPIPAAGSYEVAVTAPGYQPYDGIKSLACDSTATIALQASYAPPTVTLTVYGCCGLALPGADVVLSDGQGGTTDSSGQVSFYIGAGGTYTYTASKARFAAGTGSFTTAPCQTSTTAVSVNLSPASGYACGPRQDNVGNPRPDPIPTTLVLTDSEYGSTSLVYDPTNQWWYGQLVASFPGGCNCPASSFTIGYTMTGCGGAIGGVFLTVNWTQCEYGTCFDGGYTVSQQHCPSNETVTSTNPCAGQPNGTDTFGGCGPNNPVEPPGQDLGEIEYILTNPTPATGDDWTIAAGLPFDFIGDVAACDCTLQFTGWFCSNPDLAGGSTRFPYNAASTITITE